MYAAISDSCRALSFAACRSHFSRSSCAAQRSPSTFDTLAAAPAPTARARSNPGSYGTIAATRTAAAATAAQCRGATRAQPPKAMRVYGTAMRAALWLRQVSAWAAMA